MQKDMHYYGTYAMARAAGLEPYACEVIASSAQFVDDHAKTEEINFKDGARIDTEATAHHSVDGKNIERKDQRLVWVPFHFLPGNEGESYQERMVCRKDSEIARTMVEHALSKSDKVYALPLIGITAHVYADTFSHHGFSGYSSHLNRVNQDSIAFDGVEASIKDYIMGKFSRFIEKFEAEFAEDLSGALGHGSVATYPDRPYLKWNFEYESAPDEVVTRTNPVDFLDGCRALHSMFSKFADLEPDYKDKSGGLEFPKIEDEVATILSYQADMQGRIDRWKHSAEGGRLFAASRGEQIPDYDEQKMLQQRDSLKGMDDSEIAISNPIYHFYQAAEIHRVFILRDLLPSFNLIAH